MRADHVGRKTKRPEKCNRSPLQKLHKHSADEICHAQATHDDRGPRKHRSTLKKGSPQHGAKQHMKLCKQLYSSNTVAENDNQQGSHWPPSHHKRLRCSSGRPIVHSKYCCLRSLNPNYRWKCGLVGSMPWRAPSNASGAGSTQMPEAKGVGWGRICLPKCRIPLPNSSMPLQGSRLWNQHRMPAEHTRRLCRGGSDTT